MADEPENHTLRLLREMREEAEAFRKEVNAGFAGVNHRLSELEVTLTAMRADQTRASELLETVAETQKNQGARLNVIEGRLALIEKHTGLVKA
jgi:hypothetical protein